MRVKIILSIFVFLSILNNAKALIISEILYDPNGSDTDREWIEIYNNTNQSIDLTEIKFFEGDVNHGIKTNGDKNILSNEFVVLVQDINKFKTDFPNYTGKIFESVFSLSNTGETFSLKNKDGNTLFSITYSKSINGGGDGKSLNFNGQTLKSNDPSPGSDPDNLLKVDMIISDNTSTTTTSTTTDNNTNDNSTTTINVYNPIYNIRSYWPESEKIYVNLGDNIKTLVGVSNEFKVKVLDNNKKVNNTYQAKWSYGDGYENTGQIGKHFYKYPGEYTLNVEVNLNGIIESDKKYIKVNEPKIKVLIKENQNENLVIIKNLDNEEVDIGGMVLKSLDQNNKFNIPNKTQILGKRQIIFDNELTKIGTFTKAISLNYQNDKEIDKYFLNNKIEKQINNILSTNTLSTSSVKVFTKEDYDKLNNINSKSSTTKIMYKKIFRKESFLNNNATKTISQVSTSTTDTNSSKEIIISGNKEKSIIFDFLNKLGI